MLCISSYAMLKKEIVSLFQFQEKLEIIGYRIIGDISNFFHFSFYDIIQILLFYIKDLSKKEYLSKNHGHELDGRKDHLTVL